MGIEFSLSMTSGIYIFGGILSLYFFYTTSRKYYESAPYKLVRKDGSFEIRDYPSLRLVET